MTFKSGDKVKIKREACEWYLTGEAESCYTVPGQSTATADYLTDVAIMKRHMDDRNDYGIIDKCNWPGSEDENYRIKLGGGNFLIETKNIAPFRMLKNYPKEKV